MWMEQGLDDGRGQPAAYLHNPQIREGISAMLVLDRAEEEEHQLTMEGNTMVQWLGSRLRRVNHALSLCQGSFFSVSLGH
jgi:hypothetical protein